MEHFDLCVIGGGPAGHAAAMRAIDLGKRTLLVERGKIGGTGIYNGALASKTLWELSQREASANEIVRPRTRQAFRLSWEEISRTVNEAVFERKYLFSCHMQMLQSSGYLFQHARGVARFLGPHDLVIDRTGARTHITADHFIIATGSRPRILSDIPVDEERVMTSDGIFRLDDLPKSIAIIGAGVIGCEFATIFSNFGRTRVHLIDRASRVLPFEDADVSDLIARNLERRGVVIHHSSKLDGMDLLHDGVEYEIAYAGGQRDVVKVERVLLSVGRIPNLEGMGLEQAGLHLDPRTGLLQVEDTRTNVPHIHVVGDASGRNMLVNLGEMEGRHAVERICGITSAPLRYDGLSTIMFLDPEVAGVGLNEQECREQRIAYRMAKIEYSCIARAIAMRRTKGFFKLLVTDDDHMRVLGMRAVGEHASSAIEAVALMARLGTSVRELAELVHPHPSITEGVQECARLLLGTSIFKAPVFGDKMQCYRWSPTETPVKAA